MAMHAKPETETETAGNGVGTAQPLAPDTDDDRKAAAVEAYARDHEGLSGEDERDALDYLLSPKPPRVYGVPVDYDTDDGMRKLTFVVHGLDGRKIDAVEERNRSETTNKLDVITADCQLVVEACEYLLGQTGRQSRLDSEEFLTIRVPDPKNPGQVITNRLASPADALEARFRTQLGLVSGVAREIRRISGYDPERVGTAQRRLVDAAGN